MADKNFGVVTTVDDEDHGSDSPKGQKTGESHLATGDTSNDGFERYISLLGILNFGFTLQSAWEAIGLNLPVIFLNGGPVVLVWGTLLSGFSHTLVALSLGEMASMDPTVGAQYRWSARFAKKWPEFWGMMQGWITTFAWIVTTAGPLMGLAMSTQGLISFWYPSHIIQAWQTTLFMWAYLIIALFFNLYLRRILNVLETIGGICHLLFFVVCVIILATLAERSSVSYVFGKLIWEASGWNNRGVSFQLGLLAVLPPLSGYDSVLHMIDETRKPRERVPKTMVAAVVSNSVLQFAYAIVLMFCIGDEEAVSTAYVPLIQIYYNATKSKAATTIIIIMHLFIAAVGLFNTIASASRLTWAFAKDKGLPFASFFSRIHPTLQIPIPALALVSVVDILMSLVNLGSTAALSAIMSIINVPIFISYFIPILFLTLRKLSGEHPRYGPFTLGRWGLPINLFSLCFSLYAAFWAAFPSVSVITPETMNWSGPVFIFLILLCIGDWFARGRKVFVVPTGTYRIEMEDENEMADRSESKRIHGE